MVWSFVIVVLTKGIKAPLLLLGGSTARLPDRRQTGLALILLVPTVLVAPWPGPMAPLLIAAGLAVELLPIPRRWPRWVARGAVVAGVVMIAMTIGGLWLARSAWNLKDSTLVTE